MRSLLLGSLLALLAVGCAARVETPVVQAAFGGLSFGSKGSPSSEVTWRAPRRVELGYEIAGEKFPSPLLRATIGDRTTWLVVDTGTSYHALSGWLAADLALPLASANLGKDHVGRDIHMSVIERATIASGDWGMLVDQRLLVADVPEAFHDLNLGGFLSPQFLANDDERVLLDLERGELSVVSADKATSLLLGRGGRFPTTGSKICNSVEDVPYRTFVVPAFVDSEPVNLLIDTGAERTNLRVSSVAGAKFVARANGDPQRVYGAGGEFNALVLPNARLQLGEIGATADIQLVPGASNSDCPVDGVLGMDILRSCILVLGDVPADGRCSGSVIEPAAAGASN